MDSSPAGIAKFLLPKTPLLLKTALWHSLSMSSTASKWDLKTEITVNLLRDMMGSKSSPTPVAKIQRMTCKDPGVKGKIWVSKVKLDVPGEDDVRQMMFKAIEDMGTGEEQWMKPEQRPLEAEWNGYHADVKDDEPEPAGMNEEDKYKNLMKETKSKVTVLYFHGGAMYLMDPATCRPLTGRVSKETGGRVFNVRYRLSPQGPFPSALLDCFTAYLSLLSPPPGAVHDPVPANEIVFGGDSAGGTCCTALLQLLLQIHRSAPAGQTPTVRFHGKDVEIPLPAGVAMASPWLDITRSLPSIESGTKYDYLPPPSQVDKREIPKDDAWPANPPRADFYCEGSALMHPLVSPLAAKDWSNSPPLFFSVGEEMLRDEDAVLAQRVVAQGITVVWRDFEAMPHCFAMLLDGLPGGDVHYEEYAKFCKDVVEGKGLVSNGVYIKAKTLERSDMDVKAGLTQIKDEEVDAYMKKGKERIETKFNKGLEPSSERPML
ncbi:acetyl-hydrolase [Pyrenophora tritici-repentis]|uniref:Acetyl-hydrolase n=2 Tax=Pyrenophora tritici-repentis TaxID=45151 RepID=A0A2W1G7N8_9PLEO|nr:acetyl-hydrolase [Pyrenophora tritici-repentis Pt-1C-BFP]KAA8615755.1 acetyl-hydrolase [Pyrenophora tritici-repentis]EDU51218.1 acetyl-hydrolase [Pyrenophora tritici-repentis Pt-1C-BFP]KAF7443661.1 acetyl-hydrolase [Pyrenophora tritici-repentis]KAF7566620.1 acetyl-hydrolase [Pyrenophora tritici-repentis]KAI0577829.1 acetyl-hydrolase [Pyrenophora tritici-repentis]